MFDYIFDSNRLEIAKNDIQKENASFTAQVDIFRTCNGQVDVLTNAITTISTDISNYEKVSNNIVTSIESFVEAIATNEDEITNGLPEEYFGEFKQVLTDDIMISLLGGASIESLLMSFDDFLQLIGPYGVPGGDGTYQCCAMPKAYVAYMAKRAGLDFDPDKEYLRGNANDLYYYYCDGVEGYKKKTGREPNTLEKWYMENFEFTNLDTIDYDTSKYSSRLDYCLDNGIINEGDMLIWNGNYKVDGTCSNFVPSTNQYAFAGHSAVWHEGEICGQHQHNKGTDFDAALGSRTAESLSATSLKGMQVISYKGAGIAGSSYVSDADSNNQIKTTDEDNVVVEANTMNVDNGTW